MSPDTSATFSTRQRHEMPRYIQSRYIIIVSLFPASAPLCTQLR